MVKISNPELSVWPRGKETRLGNEEVGFEVSPERCERGAYFLFGTGKSSKELGHSD